jgi:hypothetical protein
MAGQLAVRHNPDPGGGPLSSFVPRRNDARVFDFDSNFARGRFQRPSPISVEDPGVLPGRPRGRGTSRESVMRHPVVPRCFSRGCGRADGSAARSSCSPLSSSRQTAIEPRCFSNRLQVAAICPISQSFLVASRARFQRASQVPATRVAGKFSGSPLFLVEFSISDPGAQGARTFTHKGTTAWWVFFTPYIVPLRGPAAEPHTLIAGKPPSPSAYRKRDMRR